MRKYFQYIYPDYSRICLAAVTPVTHKAGLKLLASAQETPFSRQILFYRGVRDSHQQPYGLVCEAYYPLPLPGEFIPEWKVAAKLHITLKSLEYWKRGVQAVEELWRHPNTRAPSTLLTNLIKYGKDLTIPWLGELNIGFGYFGKNFYIGQVVPIVEGGAVREYRPTRKAIAWGSRKNDFTRQILYGFNSLLDNLTVASHEIYGVYDAGDYDAGDARDFFNGTDR